MSWQSIQTALFYEVRTLVCPLFVHIQGWGIQSTNQPSGNSTNFAAKSLVDDNAHCSFGQQECYDLKCTSVPNWKGNMKQRKNEKIPFLVARRSTYSHVYIYIYIVYIHICIYIYRFHDEICADALGCVVGFNGSGEHEWAHRHRGFLCSWRRRLCTLCTIVCCCREWQCSHDKCSQQHLVTSDLEFLSLKPAQNKKGRPLAVLASCYFVVCVLISCLLLSISPLIPGAHLPLSFPCLCIDLLGPSRQTKGCPALRRAPNPQAESAELTRQGSPLSLSLGGKSLPSFW